MEFTAMQISTLINGEIEGDPDVTVSSFGKLEGAEPGQLAFLANPKYEEFLYSTKASVIIINNTQLVEKKVNATLIRVPDAYSAFAIILSTYEKMAKANLAGVQQPAYISDTATLGENIFIGAFTYIGNNVTIGNNVKLFPQVYIGDNVTIDDDSILFPGVKIQHDCIIGKNVTIHAGAVIGGDGFGFAPQTRREF